MTSNEIKSAFAAAGIKVRVKALARNFRICTVDGSSHFAASFDVLSMLGMTDALGVRGGNLNARHEIFSFAPGVIRRV